MQWSLSWKLEAKGVSPSLICKLALFTISCPFIKAVFMACFSSLYCCTTPGQSLWGMGYKVWVRKHLVNWGRGSCLELPEGFSETSPAGHKMSSGCNRGVVRVKKSWAPARIAGSSGFKAGKSIKVGRKRKDYPEIPLMNLVPAVSIENYIDIISLSERMDKILFHDA